MRTYSEHVPTAFDSHIELDGREDWLVAPVSRHRDTASALELANWQAQLEALGGESDDVEVHRFGHWGHGWYEIVLVSPERGGDVEALYSALEDYPVLNDDLQSEIEHEAAYESFQGYGESDLVEALGYGWSGLPFDTPTMWELYWEASQYTGWATEDSSEGVRLNIDDEADALVSGRARASLTALIVDYCRGK